MNSFSNSYIEYHSRHLVLKEIGLEGMKKIQKARVLIIGLGGLGSVVSLYLAHSGIGTLGICDNDEVELSNLGRQIIYDLGDLKKNKVIATYEKLIKVNNEIKIKKHFSKIDKNNFLEIINGYDLIIEAVDEFKTKILIHDLCLEYQKPIVHAGVLGLRGQLLTILPGESTCLRCFFGDLDISFSSGNCAKDGVLSPLVGILGSLQATETLKYFALKKENLFINKLLQVDVSRPEFKSISLTYRGCDYCKKFMK